MDFTKPWWDNNMAEGMSINEKLYFATGDLLTSDNDATFIIMFNKQLAKDCKLPDLYSLVENNEWTMEQFYEFEQLAVQDNGGTAGKLDYDTDVCGFAYTVDVPYCMLFGGGVTMCTKDEDDLPVYELDVELAQNIADVGKLIFSKDFSIDLNAVVNAGGISMYDAGVKTFGENHALFMGEVMQCVTRMRVADVDFGILPYPMYNEAQGEYKSLNWNGVMFVPASIKDPEMVGDVLELLAFYTPPVQKAYYEDLLGSKLSDAPEDAEMLDVIWDSVVTDIGMVSANLSGMDPLLYMFPNLCLDGVQGYSSYVARNTRSANRALEKLFG